MAACRITAEGTVALTIRPETSPINPSPWYAARLVQDGERARIVQLLYDGAEHRYRPWLSVNGGRWHPIEVDASEGQGGSVTVRLPAFAGSAMLAAQPLLPLATVEATWSAQVQSGQVTMVTSGQSRDGRPVPWYRHGPPDAAHIHVFAARQHPPETTGAVAFDAFADALLAKQPAKACPGHAFFFAPILNPDGIARGHWRTNAGLTDLNRDWGRFAEPETAAVGQAIVQAAASARLHSVLDFHSTRRDALYTSNSASNAAQQFAKGVGAATGLTVVPTQAADGNTLKSWAERKFGTDAFTVELADAQSPDSAAAVGAKVAQLFMEKLACPATGE